ncbi:MAG: AAA family ATPase [Candidatus Moeniiplasma glomeromycotorum]|nr:AAA family ATPase [Candidatus Moeniiplasma glomeromycotorum]
MNYQESLVRLEQKKKELEQMVGTSSSYDEDDSEKATTRRRLELVKKVIKGYSQSLAGEISGDKIEQVFSKLYGFEKQKEEAKSLLLLQKYFSAKGIKDPEAGRFFCFVGPPGTGKTFFAHKFAEAIGRKFFKINLGGASDTAIIRGGKSHFRSSEAGDIVKAIADTESRDPVVLLDEVDKTSSFFGSGGIENALLHVLDPEQNRDFKDEFLDVGIDISFFTFVLTANDISKVPAPLKNRLEIIRVKEYTEEQKFQIGKMTIGKIFSESYQDKNKDLFEITDGALRTLIGKVEEEGVRQLERKIKDLIRWAFTQWSVVLERGEEEQKIIIDEDKVNELVEVSKEDEPEEESAEDKLKKENEELEQENENLRAANLTFLKPLIISNNMGFCDKHNKTTCQNSEGSCALCQLQEQVKTIEAIIAKENSSALEKVWKVQKQKWIEKSNELQEKETEEEKELASQIRASIAKINQKFDQVRSNQSRSANSQPNQGFSATTLFLIIGGGVMVFLMGGLISWFWLKRAKKKKKKKIVEVKQKNNLKKQS